MAVVILIRMPTPSECKIQGGLKTGISFVQLELTPVQMLWRYYGDSTVVNYIKEEVRGIIVPLMSFKAVIHIQYLPV